MNGPVSGGAPAGGLPDFDPARLDLADPYPVYRRYRDAGPVHAVRPAAVPCGARGPTTWHVFGYAEVARVLARREFGRTAPGSASAAPLPPGYAVLRAVVENWLVFLDPPRHTALRALVAPALAAGPVAALRPGIRRIARRLVDPLVARESVDLVAEFAAPFPLLVISGVLGVPEERQGWFRERALALQRAGGARVDRSLAGMVAADRAAAELTAYFRRELDARRGPGRDRGDLLSALVRAAEDETSLSPEEQTATCVHLLTAGHETTTGLLGKAVLALLARPELGDALRADPGLLPGAVDEFLRHDPPVQMVTRWALRDTELAGHAIHAGDRTVLVLGAANRDPAYFPDPDRLDIHRDTVRHCAFGLGIHYCAGAGLARAEAEAGLAELLDRLPALRSGARPELTVRYAPDWVFHGPERLTVTVPSSDPASRTR
ncbi:cytochrome P450 [Streptomyces sp. NPDC048717]|uniref:cytochrome P450 n=1 Tax=Streptomyces sp. NPDC048717 TaxID=3154928 RepID=UPI00344069A4